MLVLTRKPAEMIKIGDGVVIKVIKTARGAVKIGIEAPEHVRVIRGELLEQSVRPEGVLPRPTDHVVTLSDQYPHVA